MPGTTSGSELQRFWDLYHDPTRHCGCGAVLADCPFWQDVLRAFGGASDDQFSRYQDLRQKISRTRGVYRLWLRPLQSPVFRRDLAEYREVTLRLYRATANVSGAKILIDSSKGAGYGWMLARTPGIEMSTLNLVRDSRAVANSWANRNSQFVRPHWSPTYSALHWTSEHGIIETLRFSSKAYMKLRYEDFVRAPQAAITEVGRVFSIPVPELKGSTIDLASGHGFAGNQPRYLQGPVEIQPNDSWREQIPVADALKVTALSWPMLLRHGYPLRYKR